MEPTGKYIELDLYIPESFFEQPSFYGKLGTKILKFCPDPGATTSWFIQDLCVQEQQKKRNENIDSGDWSKITGFSITSDSIHYEELVLDNTDIMHDGFSGRAQWVNEDLQFCRSHTNSNNNNNNDNKENLDTEGGILIPKFKMRMMTSFKESVCGIYHDMNYDGLIGLGMAKGHIVSSNWLLRACLEGMAPYFTYQCGIPHRLSPKLTFGRTLPEIEGFTKQYYKITPENDLHDEGQGSHWYLGVKSIRWKCIGEEENIIDEINFSYKEKWKNSKPDKKFRGRSWSRSWFDMGYPTIVFPSTFGNSDCIQIQKFMNDMKAGNFAVNAGTIALDVVREEIKVEYISFTFSNSCDENGLEYDCDNDIEWKFYMEDIIGSDNIRKMEVEIENKNIDRKCIIIGLPFAKKFSVEYHFDPSAYSEECSHIKGKDMLGFQQAK